jgi:DNA polymerase-3 subunit gamma/tau
VIVGVSYLVIARKYRPQTFAEVAGQDAVARTLANAIRKGRIAHAYLFTGPRGVGKTSMARILAKAMTCVGPDGTLDGPTATPCGVCANCRMITDSVHPDVAEIDAARFTGVDAIRELGDGASFAPSQARCRVFILDEVHMLSTSAWNALLKVLEEPPPHVRFIFATTEVDKVLETVLSRVQRFDFRALDGRHITDRLAEIAKAEGLADLPQALLTRIARAAGGGMRDAQTLLDQLIAVADGEPGEADLDLLLGAARGGDVDALLTAIAEGRHKDALERFDAVAAAGVAPATLIDQLVEQLRAALLVQACGAESPVAARLGALGPATRDLAAKLPAERLQRMCQILLGTAQHLRQGSDPRLETELCLVRLAQLHQTVDIDDLLRRIARLETAPAAPRPR